MLATLNPAHKQKWSQHVAIMLHAYNCTHHETTGYSPYFLMLVRQACLPVDLCFGIDVEDQGERNHHQYVDNLRRDKKCAYQVVTEAANRNHLKNKRAYDTGIRIQHLEEGDRVLIRALGGPESKS